jgi:hypothetical protein
MCIYLNTVVAFPATVGLALMNANIIIINVPQDTTRSVSLTLAPTSPSYIILIVST